MVCGFLHVFYMMCFFCVHIPTMIGAKCLRCVLLLPFPNILNTAFFLAFYNDSRKHCQTRHCTSNEHVTNKALESWNRSRKLTLKQVIMLLLRVDRCTHCSHWYLIGQEFKQIPAILWKTVNKGVNRQFPAVLDNVYIHMIIMEEHKDVRSLKPNPVASCSE